MTELNLSVRAYDRVLKVSRPVADLAQSEAIGPEHVSETIQYLTFDRRWWVDVRKPKQRPAKLSIGSSDPELTTREYADNSNTPYWLTTVRYGQHVSRALVQWVGQNVSGVEPNGRKRA